MRALLILVVFCCCAALGLGRGLLLRRRAELLRQLAELHTRLERIMREGGMDIREGLEQLAQHRGEPAAEATVRAMLSSWQQPGLLTEGWKRAMDQLTDKGGPLSLLEEGERAWLYGLLTDQAQAAAGGGQERAHWVLRWQLRAEAAENDYARKGSLCGRLGLLVGAALAVLML